MALLSTTVRVWRVVKSDDFIVRIPNCFFSPAIRNWRCCTETSIRKLIIRRSFALNVYVRSYVKLFRSANPVLKKALVVARKMPQMTPRVQPSETSKMDFK